MDDARTMQIAFEQRDLMAFGVGEVILYSLKNPNDERSALRNEESAPMVGLCEVTREIEFGWCLW